MSILARDHRLPHMFYLRAERPVYRHGIVALAIAAAVLLIAVDGNTNRLIPMFTIGVFVGFTISQVGLVRHWATKRPPNWRKRATLNGIGATMTAVAVVVALVTKFTEGAWVVVIAVPLLMRLFSQTEHYYAKVATQLRFGKTPGIPVRHDSVVIVPTTTVNLLTARALSAALSLSDTVVALAVAGDEEEREQIKYDWDQWKSEVPLEVVIDPHRSLVRSVLRYIDSIPQADVVVTVLIPEIIPRKRRREILHNQRGRILAAVLKARTNVVVATLPYHMRP